MCAARERSRSWVLIGLTLRRPGVSTRRVLVLVVDDDPVIRRATARRLRSSGFRTFEADGVEAVALLHAEGPVDAVVCDFDMPGVSGLDVLAAARCQGTPFVFHTGNAEAAATAGVPVVSKSGDGSKLVSVLEGLVA